ncbi:MAG: adenylyltransferase/cytidyltransferase family protein [bacterium]|nr:adenylyltransferase/cytidyltransferase family protein [bacterium]
MKDGKKVGITAGTFDLCHAGHMLVFKEAKTVCDYLIVALQDDPSDTPPNYRGKKKNKPVMSLEERKTILEGIRYIDEIVIYHSEKDLHDLFVKLKPDIRIIGSDWKGKPFTGHELGVETYFNSRGHSFSTSALRERVFKAEFLKMKDAERKTRS